MKVFSISIGIGMEIGIAIPNTDTFYSVLSSTFPIEKLTLFKNNVYFKRRLSEMSK